MFEISRIELSRIVVVARFQVRLVAMLKRVEEDSLCETREHCLSASFYLGVEWNRVKRLNIEPGSSRWVGKQGELYRVGRLNAFSCTRSSATSFRIFDLSGPVLFMLFQVGSNLGDWINSRCIPRVYIPILALLHAILPSFSLFLSSIYNGIERRDWSATGLGVEETGLNYGRK